MALLPGEHGSAALPQVEVGVGVRNTSLAHWEAVPLSQGKGSFGAARKAAKKVRAFMAS